MEENSEKLQKINKEVEEYFKKEYDEIDGLFNSLRQCDGKEYHKYIAGFLRQNLSLNRMQLDWLAKEIKKITGISAKEIKKTFEMLIRVEEKKVQKEAGVNLSLLRVYNFLENVKMFRQNQPFFYDRTGIFWFWNSTEFKWEIQDETDIMIALEKQLDFNGQTVSNQIKNQYMEAFRRIGRQNIPQEAPKKWIQFKDKAYSLNSGSIYQVTPDYFFTNPIPWDLGGNEETPHLDKLFTDWVGEEYKQTLYEVLAYCCYTDYPIQLLFCLYGSGRNGKSSFQKILTNFIGKKNISSTELDTLLVSRFETFKLYRKLVCTMGETNFGMLNKTSLLKKLVGGDVIGFEKKNKDPFDDFNYAKIIISSNSLPSSNDTSDGFYRRWMIIKFENEFPEGKDVTYSIPEEEYNNLALKCTKILKKLLDKGSFDKQGDIEKRKMDFILASNPLPLFLKSCCYKDDDGFVSYSELYTAYTTYLRKNKKRKVKMIEFKSALEDEGFWVERESKKIRDEFKSGRWINGLCLKSNWKQHFYDFYDNYDNDSRLRPIYGPLSDIAVRKVRKVIKKVPQEIETEELAQEIDTPPFPVERTELPHIIKKARVGNQTPVSYEKIESQALLHGWKPADIEPELKRLKNRGMIYEPRSGYYDVL